MKNIILFSIYLITIISCGGPSSQTNSETNHRGILPPSTVLNCMEPDAMLVALTTFIRAHVPFLGNSPYDINGDGVVNISDVLITRLGGSDVTAYELRMLGAVQFHYGSISSTTQLLDFNPDQNNLIDEKDAECLRWALTTNGRPKSLTVASAVVENHLTPNAMRVRDGYAYLSYIKISPVFERGVKVYRISDLANPVQVGAPLLNFGGLTALEWVGNNHLVVMDTVGLSIIKIGTNGVPTGTLQRIGTTLPKGPSGSGTRMIVSNNKIYVATTTDIDVVNITWNTSGDPVLTNGGTTYKPVFPRPISKITGMELVGNTLYLAARKPESLDKNRYIATLNTNNIAVGFTYAANPIHPSGDAYAYYDKLRFNPVLGKLLSLTYDAAAYAGLYTVTINPLNSPILGPNPSGEWRDMELIRNYSIFVKNRATTLYGSNGTPITSFVEGNDPSDPKKDVFGCISISDQWSDINTLKTYIPVTFGTTARYGMSNPGGFKIMELSE